MRGLVVVCAVVLGTLAAVVGVLAGLVWVCARAMAAEEQAEALDDPWLGPRTIPGRNNR